MGLWQSVVDAVYPPVCTLCDAETVAPGGLCGPCWREARFLTGCLCECCGAPLPGEDEAGLLCDDCLVIARPWVQGRAALVYAGAAKGMVLRLKHADRLDLVEPAARWMVQAGRPIWPEAPLLVPVPAHWSRRLRRRYDQAALLARAIAKITGAEAAPRALVRTRATDPLDGKDREARFDMLLGAIGPHPTFGAAVEGRNVVLVDDVMTSGASFAAGSEALHAAGAREVRVLALARVVKDA